jgi:hypothetical protein
MIKSDKFSEKFNMAVESKLGLHLCDGNHEVI